MFRWNFVLVTYQRCIININKSTYNIDCCTKSVPWDGLSQASVTSLCHEDGDKSFSRCVTHDPGIISCGEREPTLHMRRQSNDWSIRTFDNWRFWTDVKDAFKIQYSLYQTKCLFIKKKHWYSNKLISCILRRTKQFMFLFIFKKHAIQLIKYGLVLRVRILGYEVCWSAW